MADSQKTQLRGVLIAVWVLVFLVGGYIFWQAGGMSFFDDGLFSSQKTAALACIEEYESEFRYPDTIKLVDYSTAPERVYVTVTAENGFGVPSRQDISCPLKDGLIDETQTLIEKVDALLDS